MGCNQSSGVQAGQQTAGEERNEQSGGDLLAEFFSEPPSEPDFEPPSKELFLPLNANAALPMPAPSRGAAARDLPLPPPPPPRPPLLRRSSSSDSASYHGTSEDRRDHPGFRREWVVADFRLE